MRFYPEITKEGFFKRDFIQVNSFTDLIDIDNSFVAPFNEGMRIDGIEIPKQNERGFVSARHVKEQFHQKALQELIEEQEERDAAHVIDLLDKHETTIHAIHVAIHLLSTGRYIKERWSNAVAAIHDNQENGTGDWNIFFDCNHCKLKRTL